MPAIGDAADDRKRRAKGDFLLTESDAFFLMRLLERLDSDADRRRLVDIAEQIAYLAEETQGWK